MAKPAQSEKMKARLFDADRSDQEVELDAKTVGSVGNRQLLWVDALIGGKTIDDHAFLSWLPFDQKVIERMWAAAAEPRLSVHGDFFLVRLVVLREMERGDLPVVLDLAVARNVVLTAHRQPLAFLTELDGRIRGDTTLGEIDATDFATVILDEFVASYLALTDSILAEVDRLDGEALKATRSQELLTTLVALRHRIATVRRVLVSHRTVISSMAGADFQVITGSDAGPQFQAVTKRFDGAASGIDAAREALLGTFDIHMSRTAQRTNEAMKVLTIVTVLLLPAGVLAGFMGMNIAAPYSSDDPAIFWFVIAAIIVIAALTVSVLRVRKWL